MLTESKSIWASKGVWGGIVVVGAAVAGLFGYTISPEEQTEIVEAVSLVAAGVGGLLALWGRISATKRIG